jgi:hypothetical protein
MVIERTQGIIDDPEQLKELFGTTPTLIDTIPVDVLLSETPTHDWDITSHPVEAGLDVSDSRYKRPVSVTLDCIFTDPDFSIDGILESVVGDIATGGNLDDSTLFRESTWGEKKEALETLAARNVLIDITTPNDTYTSMMIKSIRPLYDKDKSNAFFFRLVADNLEIASSDIVAIDAAEIPDDPQAKKKTNKTKNKGKKTAVEDEKKSSVLNNLIGKYL